MHGASGRIVPGHLVVNNRVVFDAALVVRYGLVLAVRSQVQVRPGCRTDVTVMWFHDDDQLGQEAFSDMCSCELVSLDELGSTEVAVRAKRRGA